MLWLLLHIALLIAYVFYLLQYNLGWLFTRRFKTANQGASIALSVVVAFRNEAQHLPILLESLQLQTYQNFELILINDHSTDESTQICESYASKFEKITLLSAVKEGKKNAIKEAIEQANGALIVCTDADCIPHTNWLKTIAIYQEQEQCDMILGPVQMNIGNSLFSKLQALEFSSLIASTAGSAFVKDPIMSNGANMAFTPKAWKESLSNLKMQEASGDDMFLMLELKKALGKIRFIRSKEAVISTRACLTINEFVQQRIRWAKKSKYYKDGTIIMMGMIVATISALLVIDLFTLVFFSKSAESFILLFTAKMLMDSLLLIQSSTILNNRRVLYLIPILSLVYPFYILFIGISSIKKGYKWKDRDY